jgi:hypothetical protein
MSLRKVDLTKDFYTYREAIRLIWNTFLRDSPDPEPDLPDIDRVLFRAIIEGRVNVDLRRWSAGKDFYFPDLEVKTSEKEVLKLSRQPDLNVWTKEQRQSGVLLRYVGLFDFAWTEANRDFEYLQCIIVKNDGGKVKAVAGDNMLLVLARTAKIKFIPPG